MRRSGDTTSGWAGSLILVFLAILSKQGAIIAFGVVFFFEWVLMKTTLSDWKLWARTALFSLPTAAYFVLRSLWITKQNPDDPLRLPENILYPLTMAKAHLIYYFRNVAWPFEMRALAKFDIVESYFDPVALLGVLIIILSLGFAFWSRKRLPVVSFAIFAYWILFALTASIFPFRYVVTDYRQYFPFAFLSLLISIFCFSSAKKSLAKWILSGVIVYFSVSSYFINQHWKNEETFWKQSVKYGAVALAHNNYGLAITRQNPELAELHFQEALRQNPYHIYANINLGMHYLRNNKQDKGIAILRQTVRQNPDWALAHYWLYQGLKLTGAIEESIQPIRRAADLDPRQLRYQYEAASQLQKTGNKADSIQYLERINAINPNFRQTGFLLAFAHQKLGHSQLAINEYELFLEREPSHVQARFNLAFELMKTNSCRSATPHFDKVIELNPNYREAHLYLAKCHDQMGNEGLAKFHQEKYRRQ